MDVALKPLEKDDEDAKIRNTVCQINTLVNMSSLELALAIGETVVANLYGGDPHAWRERGAKSRSLRKLSAAPDLAISTSALYRALAIQELRAQLPEHPLWQVLTISHIRLVLGLPVGEQERLLSLATNERWTIAQLERAAAESKKNNKSNRGGRPPKPRFIRTIHVVEQALAREDEAFGDLEVLAAMPSGEREVLEDRVKFVLRRCKQLAELLEVDE